MGSLDDAKTSLSRALRLGAEGQTEEAERSFNEAERLLKEAITEDPANAQAHLTYARLLEARQQYDEAEVEYREARRLDPTDGTIQAAYETMQEKRQRADEVAAMLGSIEVEPLPTPLEPAVEEEVREAEIAPWVEEVPPVEEVPLEVEIPSPQEADRHWALAVFRVEQGDLAGAEEAFQQALDLASRHTEALKAYGSLLLGQQRYAEAKEHLATLMEVDPSAVEACLAGRPIDTSPPLLALRGWLYARQGESEAAEPLLRKAVELEPERVEWVVAYAGLLVDLNRGQEAIEWLHDAFARELDDAALHREYARLMAEQESR